MRSSEKNTINLEEISSKYFEKNEFEIYWYIIIDNTSLLSR